MKTPILLIDDDTQDLQSLVAALEGKKGLWQIEPLSAISEAAEFARAFEPMVVVADYSLEGTDGVTLLRQIRKNQPGVHTFVLVTAEEREAIGGEVEDGIQFLPKPCPPEQLIGEVQRTIAIESWLGNPRIQEIVAKMGEFPCLPPLYLKVVNLLNSRGAGADQIGEAIAGDLAMSAKILQTVNSSYYGYEEKVSEIPHAVSILGVDAVKTLVLAIQVFGKLGHSPTHKAIADELWHHSMSVAVAARRLMKFETGHEKAAEDAYTAGLLHDLGKLILLNAVPGKSEQAREQASSGKRPLWQVENELIGANHAEIGAYVLARWGIPVSIVEAAALHHQPVNAFGARFTTLSAVHVANALVNARKSGQGPNPEALPEEAYLQEIGKDGSWEVWQEVVAGRVTQRSASENETTDEGRPAAAMRADSSGATSAPVSRSRKSLLWVGALAAAGVMGAGIYFLTPRSEEALYAYSLAEAPAAVETVLTPSVATPADQRVRKEEPEPALSPPATVVPAAMESPPAEAPAEEPERTVPAEAEKVASDEFPEINLTGIFYVGGRALTSVNGQVLRTGDSVAGARVVRIEPGRIVLNYRGETRAFQLE